MIKIAGAGIAGLTCAIKLIRAGKKVTVYEKRGRVGERFNGDFQGIENWSAGFDFSDVLKTIGVDLTRIAVKGNDAVILGPKRKIYALRSEKPMFYLVKRGIEENTLDNYLYTIAKQEGVCFRFNSPIMHYNEADIIATGPDPIRSIAVAVGIKFNTNLDNGIWLRVNTEFNKSGYDYLVVVNQEATLASMGLKGKLFRKNGMESALRDFRKFIGNFDAENIKNFGGYGINKDISIGNSKIVLGEAAGLQDHLLGFGMRYAMESALLVDDSLSVQDYNQKIKRLLLPRIKKTIFWRKIFYDIAGNAAISLLCKAAKINPRAVLRVLYG